MPKVTVIVPVYNVAPFLQKCADSILAQTHTDIELLLVDDGSTDGSSESCDNIAAADCRVRVLHKENKGVSAARNAGLDAACGDWVCFVDGDDWVDPEYVEYLLDLARWGNATIATMRRFTTDFDSSQPAKQTREVWTGEQAVLGTLRYSLPIGCNARIFARNSIDANNVRFFEDLVVGEGFNFNCMAFQAVSRVAVGNRRLYHYRKDNANSVTTKFDVAKWQNGIDAIYRIRERTKFSGKDFERAWEYAWWRTNSDAYDLVVLSHSEEKCPEFYKKVLSETRNGWTSALRTPISAKDRLRAIVMGICPRAIPWAMLQRRKRHHLEVATQG